MEITKSVIISYTPKFVRPSVSIDMLGDTHREKAPYNKTPAKTKKYEYGRLGSWYIKSTLYSS